jgi:LAO/AO transport system kinase
VHLVDRARAGDVRALARLLTAVESGSPDLREISADLMRHTGGAHIVGITGAPGVGKSTTTSALVDVLRGKGRRVAVLAVDPSSPFSGGALLGDRVRMQHHATDDGVFIRSMASRGHLGGLSAATPQALRVLDACGFDVVLVETVGVGQSEVEVMSQTDTVLVLLAPGSGDGVQVAKAGILEIADSFVVNKADRDGVGAMTRELRAMITLGSRRPEDWVPEIITTVATRGEGVDELGDMLERHRAWAHASGDLRQRRLGRIMREIEALALDRIRAGLHDSAELADQVLAGELDPYQAAQILTESR